jgi:hypothetical protein
MYSWHCDDGRIHKALAEEKTASPEWQNPALSFFVIDSLGMMLA